MDLGILMLLSPIYALLIAAIVELFRIERALGEIRGELRSMRERLKGQGEESEPTSPSNFA